jgi:hypothetical protein
MALNLKLLPRDQGPRPKRATEAAAPDLLDQLLPEDAELRVGTLRGPGGSVEGLAAGVEVWCGPRYGWRFCGEILGSGIIQQRKRLTASIVFDLGPGGITDPPPTAGD